MKNIYKICSFLLVVLCSFVLVACGGKVTGSMSITPKRVSIDVTATIVDNEEVVASVFSAIYTIEDKKESLVNTKSYTLSSSNIGSITFDSLQEETDYIIYLYANYNSKKHTLERIETKTSQSGAEDDPFLISTYDDLLMVAKDREAYYVLENDIDCGGDDISPFFDASTAFTGGFDGKGYTISNFGFYQDASASTTYKQYSGLFGYNKGTIENLNIDTVSLSSSRGGESQIGALVGKNEGTIRNVNANNINLKVSSVGSGVQHVGGLIGYNGDKSVTTNCHITNLNLVLDYSRNKLEAGGLIGMNGEASIKKNMPIVNNCSASGKIKITQNAPHSAGINQYIGGLVGYNSCTIEDSYADVDIEMTASKTTSSATEYINYIGGLVGYSRTAGKIINCAVRSNIQYDSADVFTVSVGGIVGYVDDHCTVENSYFITKNSSISVSCRIESYTTSSTSSDVRYVKMSNDTYILMSTLYYLDDEEYKLLSSSEVMTGKEVYTKAEDEEIYTKVEGTIGSGNLYKFIENSKAFVGTIAGSAYKMDKVDGVQTGTLDIQIKENCKFEVADYSISTDIKGLTDKVTEFVNSKIK